MVKVLILEDEALISMTLQDVLADHGFQPTVARSLSDALQIIRTQSFDAAILNWRIGEETAEHLIHELEMTATAIVVLTTGGADALKARLAKHSVLDKPHILNDIVAEIKRLLAE
jgi:DNA-binding response OmpR family regulator